jgi:hypothetical protein
MCPERRCFGLRFQLAGFGQGQSFHLLQGQDDLHHFEDYMDFREEVDRIKKKDRAKEVPNEFPCLADPKTDGICPSGRSLPP